METQKNSKSGQGLPRGSSAQMRRTDNLQPAARGQRGKPGSKKGYTVVTRRALQHCVVQRAERAILVLRNMCALPRTEK